MWLYEESLNPFFSAYNRNWIIERCLRHTGTLPETNRKCSEQRSGPQKGNESSKHQFSGANLLVSGMFLVLAQHYVINSNYLLIEVLKKNRVFILFLSQDPPRFLLFIFFTSTSFGQKPTTNNPSRQKHLRKNASAMRWLRTDGKMRGLLGKKGGDSGRWSLEGSWQLPGIDKKKIKVNWHNPLRFTVNVIVLLEKARHVTALLHIFEKSVALMEK